MLYPGAIRGSIFWTFLVIVRKLPPKDVPPQRLSALAHYRLRQGREFARSAAKESTLIPGPRKAESFAGGPMTYGISIWPARIFVFCQSLYCSSRHHLPGRIRPRKPILRPPWARNEPSCFCRRCCSTWAQPTRVPLAGQETTLQCRSGRQVFLAAPFYFRPLSL